MSATKGEIWPELARSEQPGQSLELGFAFSINIVLHRANMDRIDKMIELAANLGADQLANTRYYGWALENRKALMPTPTQVAAASEVVDRAKHQHQGRMQIVYVLPDYHEPYPKPCYGGWGNFYLVVTPDGRTLPCHGATHITTCASTTRGITPSAGFGNSRQPFKRTGARRGCGNPAGVAHDRRSILAGVAVRRLP